MMKKLLASLGLIAVMSQAQAFVVTITGGGANNSVYLQVGAGTITGGGGKFSGGGTPANNSTINMVSTTVPAAQLGTSTPLTMGTDSTVTNSSYDGFAYCNTPNQIYIAGFLRRRTGVTTSANLNVTVPTSLTNSTGETINFNSISYTPSGNGETTYIVPAGTLTPGTSTFYTFAANRWAEVCLTFVYANANIVASGTYNGRITYTLVAP